MRLSCVSLATLVSCCCALVDVSAGAGAGVCVGLDTGVGVATGTCAGAGVGAGVGSLDCLRVFCRSMIRTVNPTGLTFQTLKVLECPPDLVQFNPQRIVGFPTVIPPA